MSKDLVHYEFVFFLVDMDETKLQKYKTVMCQRMLRNGTCRYALLCDFAHDQFELRRNLHQNWFIFRLVGQRDVTMHQQVRWGAV